MVRMVAMGVISRGALLARLGIRRGHPLFGLLVLLLLLVLIVLGVVGIVTLLRNQKRPPAVGGGVPPPRATGPHYDPVVTELRLRYARGELSREEYVQRAADLGFRPDPGDTPAAPTMGWPSAPP
jgi:putative membrane protein